MSGGLRGSVVWLVGGPSVGKSSIARAMQDAGGAADAFVLAGDQHLQRVLPSDALVRYVAEPVDDGWPGWTIPFAAGTVTGRPHAGPTALRILDGMYRAAAAMAAAGNNVVIEDVVWEPAIAELGPPRAADVGPHDRAGVLRGVDRAPARAEPPGPVRRSRVRVPRGAAHVAHPR